MGNRTSLMGIIVATLALSGCGHRPEEASTRPAEVMFATVEINGKSYEAPLTVTAEGSALIEGDLIVASAEELQQKGLFVSETSALWPKGIVRYKIDGNLPNKTRVRDAIGEWERSTNIRFVAANAADRSYLLFAPAQDATNCSTRVGYSGTSQVLYLGSACKRGNVAHEIAHALGVAHEHMRSDQSRYISIQWANIPTEAKHNFEPKPRKYSDIGPYCYGSIMHYPRNAFSKNERDTIIPKRNVRIGQRDALAACDISLVERMYRDEFRKR